MDTSTPAPASSYALGDAVHACHGGGAAWYAGRIIAVHRGAQHARGAPSFAIAYDDAVHDDEPRVEARFLRPLARGGLGGRPPPSGRAASVSLLGACDAGDLTEVTKRRSLALPIEIFYIRIGSLLTTRG